MVWPIRHILGKVSAVILVGLLADVAPMKAEIYVPILSHASNNSQPVLSMVVLPAAAIILDRTIRSFVVAPNKV